MPSTDVSHNSKQLYLKKHSSENLEPNDSTYIPLKSTLPIFKRLMQNMSEVGRQGLETVEQLSRRQGVHSGISMKAAGFYYTGEGDTVRCNMCELVVSGWTKDMIPFTVHKQLRPECELVRSIIPDQIIRASSTMSIIATSATNDDENPSKRQKIEMTEEICQPIKFNEMNIIKQIRRRTFSHWSHRSPPRAQMIEAGFFSCNVGDRVICLYCNIVCQEWIPQTDDPCEVHKLLSPKCPYVVAMSRRQQMSSICIVNEELRRDNTIATTNNDPLRFNEIVYTTACHRNYIEIPRRHVSFATWPNENLPSVDDLVRAGFFYTGTRTIVTCFYCNGSLQNWGAKDNPTIEHARWFPHCAYAKQLCGADLYRKIQESKRAQQGSLYFV